MKRILVTGGAGFIGSHLCEYLINKGHDVICVDNFFTGKKGNVKHLLSNHNFELIRHDVVNPIFLEVDQIYHLACPASPIHYQYNPIKTIKTAFLGTYNMLGLAKRVKARILLASTSEIYGNPLEHPQKEQHWGNVNPIGIRSCYDEGKRAAECVAMDYHRQHNTDIRIARIFNTYGPKMARNDGRVISNFIIQALNNEPITVYGEGKQTRSFCYVTDLIEGLYKLMNSDSVTLVNIGNPDENTIVEIANKIKTKCNSQSKIIFKELPPDDPIRRRPDITLAKKELKWEPKIKFDEGLQNTISWFKQN